MKKAIITGATGFIGAFFVDFLLQNGIEVLAIGRKKFEEISLFRQPMIKNATYVKLEMNDIVKLSEKIDELHWDVGDDCVFINLAWGGKSSLSDLNVEAQMKNVRWTISALEIANKIKCKLFLQIGTMEEAFTYKYLELNHNNNNEYNRHLIYSVAKITAKKALEIKANQIGIDYIYVLHSHVMGPNDDKDSFLQVTLQKLINGDELIFSTGEQIFDVISVSDCCYGYHLICQKGIAGSEYWVGSGHPKKLREYVERMYSLFPSDEEMQFGKLSYNDIKLCYNDFSIETLVDHTGFKPRMTFEQTVAELHNYLVNIR